MTREQVNMMIGGEAGQGLVTIGELLVKSLVRSGFHIVVTQDYMSRIRGGHNTFSIRASANDVQAPSESIDLLIALNAETVELHRQDMNDNGLILADKGLENLPSDVLAVPFKDLAEKRYENIAALGVAGSLLGLDQELIAGILEKRFGKKHPEAVEPNRTALNKAYEWCEQQQADGLKLTKPDTAPQRIPINGNQAVALGAMAGGVKLCAFYPMTPSTSVALTLAANAKKMGLVVEQAEDEIAAINMAVGGSYAGAPSILTTSGGGFALMTEGISLAAMTETPVVVFVCQRPGPATGLPTRTGQTDLEFILYAGHGEFGRAIFAPGTVEQCFHLTRKAFEMADMYQGPAFVMSDQFLADSFRAVEPFDLNGLNPVQPADVHDREIDANYLRYKITDSGVSPRLLPGLSKALVVTDSDEHTEDGHITEDLVAAQNMNDKRMRKTDLIRANVIPPDFTGDDRPDLLLVCWGSSLGAVLEAADSLRNQGGRSVGVLHFSQVWPLVNEQYLPYLESAGQVIAVEGNATGQLKNLIRRESGFHIPSLISRYDGLPFTPDYIVRRINN
jgi:2-oxoglutarate ferredoxin oxidoreductase subunit alpha